VPAVPAVATVTRLLAVLALLVPVVLSAQAGPATAASHPEGQPAIAASNRPAAHPRTMSGLPGVPGLPGVTDLGTLSGLAAAEVAHYADQLPPGTVVHCTAPATYPAPGTVAWEVRDVENQLCATQRLQDEITNPASALVFAEETPGIFTAQTLAMAEQPGHLHLSLGQLVPGASTADPFRTIGRWTAAGRGRVVAVHFPASDGATLNGEIFEPPVRGRDPVTGIAWGRRSKLPGVVITTGSIQGYQNLYFWAAEGLAEAGYLVLTYDVQGQGMSDTFPGGGPVGCVTFLVQHHSLCPGVPFQQSYNFFQGAEDALNFFLSTPAHPYVGPPDAQSVLDRYDPAWSRLDPDEVGIAGHSLGATAVSVLAQCDPRVRAVVAWDYLAPASGTCRSQFAGLPADAPADPTPHAPALTLNSDYFLNPEPMTSQPAPQADPKSAGFHQVTAAGVDAMQISLRASTHLEYTYVPYILPASRLGERVAFFFTLAWFDRYLRGAGDPAVAANAYRRLVAHRFDDSADLHSIGSGTFSLAAALHDPTNPAAGNVPYTIDGLAVSNRLSIYEPSMFRLTDPTSGTVVSCNTADTNLGHQCWGGRVEP
jgi:dienelactone hydrolase